MLNKVTITDNTNTPLSYIRDLWENGTSWEFKPGVNIIIGKNGCGKSSLLRLITSYGLCIRSMISKMPDKNNLLELDYLFNHKYSEDFTETVSFKDGCKVEMDYQGILFRYMPAIEQKGDEALNGIDSFTLHINSNTSSMGGIYARCFIHAI